MVDLRTPVASSVRAYAHLANLYFLDYNLGYLLVATLLPASVVAGGGTWAALALIVAGYFLVHCAVIAFDDVTGFRDGTDAKNYRDNPSALRRLRWKPLVTGELRLPQALRFAWACVVVGLALLVAGLLVAPHHPVWLVVLAVAGAAVSVQYSYGLKFSHIGFQELVLFLWTAELVFVPFWALTGGVTAHLVVEGALFAFWLMMVSFYSNLRDLETDRGAGRINLATIAGENNYIRILGVLAVADLAVVALLVVNGVFPLLLGLLLAPVFAARIAQFRVAALRRDPLLGRLLGRRLAWSGAVLMAIGNLVQ
ncbi:UbiA family prenyltransferase [Actinophytocola gossypii]|uniref:UbiA family prenyltransferase n=1 Tax=Actinophytocola gossypii TaxID=2812003 RepID=A0ABT2J5V7_9PSEU|nr:UbiA family prenyltransferase [Actinophytocola gossypii]MCT2582979.1 UbiA family prenyltransferase [Actinophytocola gossypii]